MKLAAIATSYIEEHRKRAQRELRYYAIQRSLHDAIREASLSCLPSGKRHPHQRRIPGRTLNAAERALQQRSAQLKRASSFLDLHVRVKSAIGNIHGIGDLAIYDIAHRIGAHLNLEPELIYLHAGTSEGARALGIRGKTVERSQLPRELHHLSPAELEDCLCIYKSALRSRRQTFSPCVSQG